MVFCATAASIVSGTVAERIKLWPFLIFVVVLTGFIYPISGSWQWGGGWLSEMASPTSPVRRWCTRSAAGPLSQAQSFCSAPQGQVWSGGKVNPMPGSNDGAGHARHLHPVARLVRLQRRIAARHGHASAMCPTSARIFANTNLAAAAVA
jgi:Amt family ammonium transporter